MKEGIRIAAFAGEPFIRKEKSCRIIGVIGRGTYIEGIISFSVEVDGSDATDKLIKSIKRSRFGNQVKLVAINGVSFAGLNIIDMVELGRKLSIPVIAMTRKKPHMKLIKRVLLRMEGGTLKMKALDKIAKKADVFRYNGVYLQSVGIKRADAEKAVGNSKELLRVAHIVASGAFKGESKGRM